MDDRKCTLAGFVALAAMWLVGCAGGGLLGGFRSDDRVTVEALTSTADPSQVGSLPYGRGSVGKESADSAEEQEAARLAAIEEFLARTADYQGDSTLASSASEVMRSLGGDGGHASPTSAVPRERVAALSGRAGMVDGADREAIRDRTVEVPEAAQANARMSLPAEEPRVPRPALPTLLSVSVRPPTVAPVNQPSATMPSPSGVTNVALDVRAEPRAFRFEDWLADLSIEADGGRNFPAEWKLRLVELAVGREVTADEFGPALSGEAKSLLASLLNTVMAVREVLSNPLAPGDTALARADQLRATLVERTDPVISTVALCQRVVTFGTYDELPLESLMAGREVQAIVYSEIQNLRAVGTGDGRFETRLTTRLELFNTSGLSVWMKEEPEIVDVCRRRRSDFFVAQRVTFPPTIPAGDYVLKVGIEDRHAGRVAEHVVPVVMQSPVSVARGR